MIRPGYRERQDAQVALQARQQIEYCERMQMARGRKPKLNVQAETLGQALAFVSAAGTKEQYQHVELVDHWALMFDGQVSAGHKIEEDLECCPHLGKLQKALSKCGKSLSITLLDSGRLSVKGDSLRALVPCEPASPIEIGPDPYACECGDEIKQAFKVTGVLADENETTQVYKASLLLDGAFCSGCNGGTVMQYWHGYNLPPGLVIPKLFAAAVAKQEKKIVGLGWTPQRSVTFFFADGSWLKTVLYADPWPDVNAVLNHPNYPQPVPDKLFEGMLTVSEFGDDGVYTVDGSVQSNVSAEVGAQFEVAGLQGGKHFSEESIKLIAPYVESIDLTSYPDRVFFYGCANKMRGLVTCIVGSKPNVEG